MPGSALWRCSAALLGLLWSGLALAAGCPGGVPGTLQLHWGDLHAHTAWSLDAWAFGNLASPAEAIAFARGEALELANRQVRQLERPLDFVAITDHAESFDVMYSCTDPQWQDNAYCADMRDAVGRRDGLSAFINVLLPLIARVPAVEPPICIDDPQACSAASRSQWRRIQEAANAGDTPCEFTAFVGYEWSPSPGLRHWHRNIIFRSAEVPREAYGARRYPDVHDLWRALDAGCQVEDGCDVLAIPHNINWTDGNTFDVEREDAALRALRARYERVAEMHQEKGNSECLPADPEDLGSDPDCGWEYAEDHAIAVPGAPADPAAAWARKRSTYWRSLLTRGLLALDASPRAANPLMLGAIGSTDGHFGTPGSVAEHDYWGSMAMLWQDDSTRLADTSYNPGGLVAVWAPENTRGALFDALQARHAYATSGPRIRLRFGAVAVAAPDAAVCADVPAALTVPMGGSLSGSGAGASAAPRLVLEAEMDRTPLERLQVVAVRVRDGVAEETVHTIAEHPDGRTRSCVVWQDPDFDPAAPALWYARVLEQPTDRWSRILCRRLDLCIEYPDADRRISERAWSSPVWYEPGPPAG